MKLYVPLYVVTGLRNGKRYVLSKPCSRLEAIRLRDWVLWLFGNHSSYSNLLVREAKSNEMDYNRC